MTDKLSPALDPAAYLAMSANLASGLGDPSTLKAQSEELLVACQAGDYTVLIRHYTALILSSQMAAHNALQRSMQCETPQEQSRWLDAARTAQQMADKATSQVVELTNTEAKLRPYHQQVFTRALAAARTQVTMEFSRQNALQRKAETQRLEVEKQEQSPLIPIAVVPVSIDDNW